MSVEWLSFGANAGAKKVGLQCETSTEPGNTGFYINPLLMAITELLGLRVTELLPQVPFAALRLVTQGE